jgi:hypothetical protein
VTEVSLPAAAVPRLPLPALCVRTGAPTTDTERVEARHTPPWAYLLLLLGIVGVIAAALAGEKCVLNLPVSPGVRSKRRLGHVCGYAGGIGTPIFLIGAFALPGATTFGLLAVFVGLAVYATYLHHAHFVGLRYDGTTVRIRRVAPAFATATEQALTHHLTLERQRALAGWHPDPSGTHRLRWYDGLAWTEHVA